MVRYLVAFGVLVAAGLALEERAGGMAGGDRDAAAAKEAIAEDAVAEEAGPGGEAAEGGTPVAKAGLAPCRVCDGPACVSVRVQGPCTVKGAAGLLRTQSAAQDPLSAAERHGRRAAGPDDFTPLAGGQAAAPVVRAEAAPQQAPGNGTGIQMLDLIENADLLFGVNENGPSSIRTQFFRPLDLGDEKTGDDEADADDADGEDEENP